MLQSFWLKCQFVWPYHHQCPFLLSVWRHYVKCVKDIITRLNIWNWSTFNLVKDTYRSFKYWILTQTLKNSKLIFKILAYFKYWLFFLAHSVMQILSFHSFAIFGHHEWNEPQCKIFAETAQEEDYFAMDFIKITWIVGLHHGFCYQIKAWNKTTPSKLPSFV